MEKEEGQDNNFTARELKYFLDKLQGMKGKSSLSTLEREIVEFLIKQTQRLLENGKVNYQDETNKHFRSDSNNQNLKAASRRRGSRIRNSLKNKIGQFIIVYIKTGGEKCKMKGILSNVYQDFIVLINNLKLFEIKINDIAAIEVRVSSGESECSGEKIRYKDQYYLDEKEFVDNSPEAEPENTEIRNNKEQKNYNIKREQKDYSVSDK